MKFIEDNLHCLIATSSAAGTSFLITEVEDIVIRIITSVVVGLLTWSMTKLLEHKLKK